MKKVLIVAAHPDDEILGAGGTLIRHVTDGDAVFALILGEGETSRWTERKNAGLDAVESLHRDALDAGKIIGFSEMYFADFPDNRFDSAALLDIVKCIEKYIKMLQPGTVYTHHGRDLNIDHRIAFQAVLTATRPLAGCSVKELYAFETVSSTEWNYGGRENAFCPNVFMDIGSYIEQKCSAMEKYKSELCQFPHPRSLEMLRITARRWGATVGKEYVEAFELIRKLG